MNPTLVCSLLRGRMLGRQEKSWDHAWTPPNSSSGLTFSSFFPRPFRTLFLPADENLDLSLAPYLAHLLFVKCVLIKKVDVGKCGQEDDHRNRGKVFPFLSPSCKKDLQTHTLKHAHKC